MEFLKMLAEWRNPFLDGLMSIITMLGEESLFIAIALAVFWCVDKKRGYYLLFIGFVGTVLNQFLKMLFRIPRPWVKDPSFEIVESARASRQPGIPSPADTPQPQPRSMAVLRYPQRSGLCASSASCWCF